MDRFRAMTVFVAAAQAGSLSGAARRLSMPLTTVSRHLAWLETHVCTTLISRTTRHMALTDAGSTYLEVCRRVLDDLDGAESALAGRGRELAGDFTMTAPIEFGRLHVLPIVQRFLTMNPRVNCQLILSDRNVDLAKDGVDIAIRIGALADSSLIASKVGTLRLLTCAAESYLKIRGIPDAPPALATHDCIAFSNIAGGTQWQFRSAVHGRHSVRIKPRLNVNTAEAAIDATVAGLGVARVLSYQAEAAIKKGRLRTILDDYDDTVVPVQLMQRSVRLPKPPVRAFIPIASEALRKRLKAVQLR